jgi:hypothetical protein
MIHPDPDPAQPEQKKFFAKYAKEPKEILQDYVQFSRRSLRENIVKFFSLPFLTTCRCSFFALSA